MSSWKPWGHKVSQIRCVILNRSQSPCSLFSNSLSFLFCRIHRWWSPHPETLVRDRPPHSDWRSETCWQDVHCVCILKIYTYHWNNDWKPLCSHQISCSYSIYWTSGHKCLSLKTWSWLASQDWSTTNVFFLSCVCCCRDRSDTAVVGSSRPVCKTNPKSTLSPPSLTSLPLPLFLALVTFLENILSTIIELCVSSVHCVLATFVLRSKPLYVIWCLSGRVSKLPQLK